MTRAYYRLALSAACALAALAGPVIFLEDRPRIGYLAGGLGAALCAWLFLSLAIQVEQSLPPLVLGVLGAGAGVFSWVTVSLVAVFEVIPHVLQAGPARFDPVWILGGLSPVVILGVAWWRAARKSEEVWHALTSALFRFSVPLLAVQLAAKLLALPKQYWWLALFTGVMFLVLDALGDGRDWPLDRRDHRGPSNVDA